MFLFILSSGQILLPRYVSSNLIEIYSEFLVAPTNDLIRFWRSKVKVTASRQCGNGIPINAWASKSIL